MKPRGLLTSVVMCCFCHTNVGAELVDIGFNYPKIGAYKEQGLAQIRGALLASTAMIAVKGKSRDDVIKDRFSEDFFEILDTLPAEQSARTYHGWAAARRAANKPPRLQ